MLFTYVRYSLGTLLAVTAVLKLHLLLTDPFADISVNTPKLLLWLGVFLDGFLAFVLFRGNERLAWTAAVGGMSVFLAVSITRAFLGQQECGCMGTIAVPIWVSIAFNTIVMVALICSRNDVFVEPGRSCIAKSVPNVSNVSLGYVTGSGFAALIFGLYSFGGGVELVDWFMGARAVVAPRIWLPNLEMGMDSTHTVTINNTAAREIEIIGRSRSCDCVTLSAIRRLPSESFVPVEIVVRPRSRGRFHQRISFFLDYPTQAKVDVDLIGNAF